MIPDVKAKLLEGKRGLIVGIANDQSIAWGCAKAFRALGAELAVTYLNDKAKNIRRAARPRTRGADRHAARRRRRRARSRPCSSASPRMGQSGFPRPLDRLLAEGYAAGPRGRCAAGGLPHHHGRVLLVVHPHGTSGRAADDEGRHALHDDLLRQPDGRRRTTTSWASPRPRSRCAVRYLAAELGPKGIRVHAISPGPLATRAASGIPEFDELARQGPGQRRPPAAWSASTMSGWPPPSWRTTRRGSSPARRSTSTAAITSSTSPRSVRSSASPLTRLPSPIRV